MKKDTQIRKGTQGKGKPQNKDMIRKTHKEKDTQRKKTHKERETY